MRFRALFLSLCTGASGVAFAGDAAAPEPADFSVLTPSMDGQFFVATQLNLNAVYPLIGLPSDLVNRSRTGQLRKILQTAGYDPARTLADRLIQRLVAAGYSAVHEPIKRKPAGSVQSLSWSDLPEKLQGRFLLDLNIRWICLCSPTSYLKAYPGISISWRLLEPPQELVLPSRNLDYYHIPWDPPKRWTTGAEAQRAEPPPYPPVTVSEGCGFGSLDETKENPAQLLGCLGEAFDVAVERLVIDLKRLRPPTTPVTASGDSPSGKSTQ
jgi:hypothetical protein